ncbi:MAG: AMP-binding protein [Pseudomonadota bacterium]|nr:AMP-binding protein [Pseudomonadota bacterium]
MLELYPEHDYTLYGLLESRSAGDGDRPFLLWGRRILSWAGFRKQVDEVSAQFVDVGVRKGDRVAIAAENGKPYLVAVFALAKIGAIVVPINYDLGVEEVAYIVEHAGVSGVLGSAGQMETLRNACARKAPAPWFATMDHDAIEIGVPDRVPWHAMPASVETMRTQARADDTWVILYTSGTTGFPKGVMHSQRAFVLVGEAFVERMHLQPGDRMLCVLPLFHINALFYSLGGALAAGTSLIIVRRFSASRFWQIAADTRATQVNIIAAVGHILARRSRDEFRPDHCLVKVYGAPISAEIRSTFQERFHIPKLIEGYGLTEAPGVCSLPFLEAPRIGSMGRAARHPTLSEPFAEMRLVDDTGNDIAVGSTGELLVRTPAIMQGYYRDSRQTAESFYQNWFRTGDLVNSDADGFYYFRGRKKDIIRRRGENIAAAEVERIIRLNPLVQDVAVIGTAAELGEEDVVAIVLPTRDARIEEADIARWCRDRLADYKVPRYVALVAELPYTPSHRVAKHRLKLDPSLLSRAVDVGDVGGT